MRLARPLHLVYYASLALLLGAFGGVLAWRLGGSPAWGLAVAAVLAALGLRRPWGRWRARRRGLPGPGRAWLEGNVPFYVRLDDAGRRRFEDDVAWFVDEHTFEGVSGVEVTDELRLAVGAGAAMLLHGRPDWELPAGRTILFYPGTFDDDYYADTSASRFDGMVHAQGPVILSVEAVEESWAYPDDGSNVVLHELAHLFDVTGEAADGAPSLMDPASADAWERLVKREMRAAKVGRSMLRRYAGTAPAELFAVATENFFERADELFRRHPDLFKALAAFYNVDPRPGATGVLRGPEAARRGAGREVA